MRQKLVQLISGRSQSENQFKQFLDCVKVLKGIGVTEAPVKAQSCPKIGSTNFRKVQQLVQALFGFSVKVLKGFGVVEAPARAWSHWVTKNWFNRHLEGPRIGSSMFLNV